MTDKNLAVSAETLLAVGACITAAAGSATQFERMARHLADVSRRIDAGDSPAGAVRISSALSPEAPAISLPHDLTPWDALNVSALLAAAGTLAGLRRLMDERLSPTASRVLDDLDDLRRRLAAGDTPRQAVAMHALGQHLQPVPAA